MRVGKCCCCGLYTGGLIIGWLGFVGSILSFISLLVPNAKVTAQERYAALVIVIIYGVISGLLIHGIKQRNHKLILPWLIMDGIAIIILTIPGALFLLLIPFLGLPLLLILGLGVYFWVVVWSLYKDIQNTLP